MSWLLENHILHTWDYDKISKCKNLKVHNDFFPQKLKESQHNSAECLPQNWLFSTVMNNDLVRKRLNNFKIFRFFLLCPLSSQTSIMGRTYSQNKREDC